jgi:hypothetical protein
LLDAGEGRPVAERSVKACLERWGFGDAEVEVVEWLEDYGYVVDDARLD